MRRHVVLQHIITSCIFRGKKAGEGWTDYETSRVDHEERQFRCAVQCYDLRNGNKRTQ